MTDPIRYEFNSVEFTIGGQTFKGVKGVSYSEDFSGETSIKLGEPIQSTPGRFEAKALVEFYIGELDVLTKALDRAAARRWQWEERNGRPTKFSPKWWTAHGGRRLKACGLERFAAGWRTAK